MKKRILAIFLVVIMTATLLPATASAAESKSDPRMFRYWELDSDKKTVTIIGLASEYEDYQGHLYIPGKVNLTVVQKGHGDYTYYKAEYDEHGDEYTVTRIDDYAFYYSAETAKLTSVTIEEGVTTIGGGAFMQCETLTNIYLPESLTKIEGNAFAQCYALKRVYIPAGVTEIGMPWEYSSDPNDSYNCNTAFFIPLTLVRNEDGTYSTLGGSLSEISVSEDNTHYTSHEGVLYNKDMTELICCPVGKAGAYVIPDGVEKIWPAAFAGCQKLTDLTIPASVSELPYVMYYHHPNGDGYPVDVYQFSDCEKLTSVTILNPALELADHEYWGVWDTPIDTIYGYNGSTAETYARQHDIAFVSLGDAVGSGSTEAGTLTGKNGKSVVWSATKAGRVAVNAAALSAGEKIIVAGYNNSGRLTVLKLLDADHAGTQIDPTTPNVKLFWLGANANPLSPSATVWGK